MTGVSALVCGSCFSSVMVPGVKRTAPSRAVNGSSDARMLMSISYRSPFAWSALISSAAQASPSSRSSALARFALTFARTRRLYPMPNVAIVGQKLFVAASACFSESAKGWTTPCESLYMSLYVVHDSVKSSCVSSASLLGGCDAVDRALPGGPPGSGSSNRNSYAMFFWPSIVYSVDSPWYAVGVASSPRPFRLITVAAMCSRSGSPY